MVADSLEVRSLVEEARAYQAAGASILTLSAPGRIEGASCEALNEVDGVSASGAIRQRSAEAVIPALPDSPVPVFEATASMPLLPGVNATAMYVSLEVAEALKLTKGDALTVESEEGLVGGVFDYPLDGRRTGFGWSVVVVVPQHALFDECWVSIWPENDSIRALLLQVVAPQSSGVLDGESPQVAQLNQTLGSSFAGSDTYEARTTRFARPVAFALGLAIAFVAVRSRRLELASNLHAGARKDDLLLQSLLEMAAWALPVALSATLTGALAASGLNPEDGLAITSAALIQVILFLAGCSLGASIATLGISERHFFRYFKDRN